MSSQFMMKLTGIFQYLIFKSWSRWNSMGYIRSISVFISKLINIIRIGLPPVIKFGTKDLNDRVVAPCLNGDKFICLAITEPWAGSDVANIQTTAVLSADKTHYVVNGLKKWITNGINCDFFTTAVRTGGKGMKGLSLVLIEKEFPGIKLKKMKCQGMWASGTTFIVFEDVKVPAANLIGKEGDGFK